MRGEIKLTADSFGHAGRVYSALRKSLPSSRDDLRNYVKVFLGIDVPDVSLCEGHSSPMDYLWHCFSGDFPFGTQRANGDAVVWANRAGGKTQLGAIATLLDCIFKANCQVRILGGSLEQSSRMYEYLAGFVAEGYEDMLSGVFRKGKCQFVNGSAVQVLTQSSKSVRGTHVHKLRCDEVELFDPAVLEASRFTTQSKNDIVAAMETISTMHRPYGLMQEAVTAAGKDGVPVFKWCMWEVIEKCRGRSCSQCALDGYCQGKAKRAKGYLSVDDCITQMRRASKAGFESEMLCMRPSTDRLVFAEFDHGIHVRQVDYDPSLPLYRAIDFGFVNPFVCLWIQVDEDGCVRVIDEYIRRRATIDTHGEELKLRTPCREERVTRTYCDPAGAGVNDVTGTSPVAQLRAMGIRIRYRRSQILEGIELVRRAIRSGDGKSRLMISPQCVRLIEAMECYHYADSANTAYSEIPDKDGVYDHPIDALRYFFVNYKTNTKTTCRRY